MVVAPYNAQVRCLRETLDRAGTPSRGRHRRQVPGPGGTGRLLLDGHLYRRGVPRNLEFLFSRNRLNVAVSRARCLAVLIASPELMTTECKTVEQMRLVNALCLLDEYAENRDAREPVARGNLA